MHVLGHDNGGMELEASLVASATALQHGVASLGGEWLSVVLAKCYEKRLSRFLIVRQRAAVFVHSIER